MTGIWISTILVTCWIALGSWVAVFPDTLEKLFGVGYGFKDTWGVDRGTFEYLTLGTLLVIVAVGVIGYARRRSACASETATARARRSDGSRPSRPGSAMTSDAAAPELVEGHIAVGDKGLKAGALGYLSNLVIGVASTAPAYSLAATLGFIVAVKGVGVHAPAVLIVSFVPMLFVALGYKYLNKADPDCGTTFAWTTRAFGPCVGWINGWAIFVADVIVMASLSVIAAQYTYLLFGWNRGSELDDVDHHRRGRLDRADDLDLLPRHRAVGADAGGAAHRRDRSSSPRSRSSRS